MKVYLPEYIENVAQIIHEESLTNRTWNEMPLDYQERMRRAALRVLRRIDHEEVDER
jgi:hypothetical protein